MKRLLAAGLVAVVASGCKSPSGSKTVTVDRVVISAPTLSINVGGTVQLSAQARTSTGDPVTGVAIAWSALDPAVAGVDANGLATGLGAGTGRIVASAAGRADTVTLTVVAPTGACTPQTAISLAVGGTVQLAGAAGGVLCLPGTAAGAEYTIVPFFESAAQGASTNLRFVGSGLVAPTGPPNPSLAPADAGLLATSSDHGHATRPGDGGFHVRLRG
jgi:hypothetical protein